MAVVQTYCVYKVALHKNKKLFVQPLKEMHPFVFIEFIVVCYILLHLIYLWSLDCNMELSFLTKFGKPINILKAKFIRIINSSKEKPLSILPMHFELKTLKRSSLLSITGDPSIRTSHTTNDIQ
ncbi:dehydrogenase/reductase SDR family member 7 [Vespula maculifrons]|uniref:Dehydrogenase/reductase SDR family member 7 n=1 Tax=Vespula maculifrons TaxID=7453 RepID=A0ABD2B980_VESMC